MTSSLSSIRSASEVSASGIKQLDEGANHSASSGLVVQAYCIQVAQQPFFIIPQTDLLKDFPDINSNLSIAKGNASRYLNSVQPKVVGVFGQVRGFSSQFKAFQPVIMKRLSDWRGGNDQARNDLIVLIGRLKADTDLRIADANKVLEELGIFRDQLNGDISNFNTAINKATTIIQGTTGSGGALDALKKQLSDLDGQIAGASVGVALSGLTIIGGTFLIVAGAVGGILTGGASTPLVVAGVAVVLAGGGGLTASSIVLASLIKTRSNLLVQEQQIKDSVKFLEGLNSSLTPLNTAAGQAVTGATNMYNAWTFLGKNLGEVQTSLQNASDYRDLDSLVEVYLNTAYGQWDAVGSSIKNIETQLAGVKVDTPTDAEGKPLPVSDIYEKYKKAA